MRERGRERQRCDLRGLQSLVMTWMEKKWQKRKKLGQTTTHTYMQTSYKPKPSDVKFV